jgi:DNA-directed RNA polymerase specialized sigma24 family protein
MRRRLVAYFDRKNCLTPEELADETLNRVARRLEEEGEITDATPAQYCYIVAKFVFLEYLRRGDRDHGSLDDSAVSSSAALRRAASAEPDDSAAEKEVLLDCLDACLQKLEPENRELISLYYHGDQRARIDNRRQQAARLGLTVNALSIRACRIRGRLEACVTKCASTG